MMRQINQLTFGRRVRWPAFCGLLVLCGGLAQAPAASEDYLPSSIRALQMVLKADAKSDQDLDVRRKALEDLTSEKKLRNADLRAALALDSWKDLDRFDKLRAVDAGVREGLIKRFEKFVGDLLTRTGAYSRDSKLAAVAMLGSMGINVYRAVGDKKVSLAAKFAPELETLLKDPDPSVRTVAALSLGQINPDPEPATKALGTMLTTGTPGDRRAAAEGLTGMMRVLVPLIMNKSSAPVVEVGRGEAVQTAQLVVNTASQGLTQSDPEVQRSCLNAMHLAAVLLGELGDVLPRDIPPPGRAPTTDEVAKIAEYHREVDKTLMEVDPLAKALGAQVPAMSQCLAEVKDPGVTYEASRALSALGHARGRLLRKAPMVPEKAGAAPTRRSIQLVAATLVLLEQQPPADKDDLLGPPLQKALPALSRLVLDRSASVDSRLEALEAMVMMGRLAAPAIAAPLAVLNDPNPFIRWAACRLLGKIGVPDDARALSATVRALTARLDDEDIDVRKAANAALTAYGPVAAPASLELAVQVEIGSKAIYNYLRLQPPAYGKTYPQEAYGDAEVKLDAMRTLQSIGIDAIISEVKNPEPIVRAVRVALRNTDLRVREAAAMTLAQFGPVAVSAVPDLKQALVRETWVLAQEPEQDRRERHRTVRQAIADALLAVTAEK